MRTRALVEAEGYLTDEESDLISNFCAEKGSACEIWLTWQDAKKLAAMLKDGKYEIEADSGEFPDSSHSYIETDYTEENGWEQLFFEDNIDQWEGIFRKRKEHEVAYESLQEKRMLSPFEQLRVMARRKTNGRIVFSDRINYADVAPVDARTILAVWKTKSLNDKAKIEKGVGKDETTYKRILKWCREQVRFENEERGYHQ